MKENVELKLKSPNPLKSFCGCHHAEICVPQGGGEVGEITLNFK